ncbi:metal transporter [Halostella sp. JP-L12]|uniref:ZIP family metal transporter n=1 Tax=Halostella TaxID=1843185 RepID=UPI000EF7DD31|nr:MULTISPECIES: metal transporter [Halostella]NHN46846.1 metal transporter [Halostella sp. JP-L12]
MAGDDLSADGGTAADRADSVGVPLGLPRWVAAAVPLVLLALVVAWFLVAPPLGGVQSGEPLPDVSVSHATLPDDGSVVLHVVNNGPDSVTVSQVLVDEAYWQHAVTSGGEEVRTLSPGQSAEIRIPYHWQPGWDLEVAIVLADGTTVHHDVVAPQPTPGMTAGTLGTLAVVGLFVGVIPVALGMLWFPFMRSMSDRRLHAVLAFSAGVLAFLGFDAGFEAFEVAESVPGAYEGQLLVVLGVLGAMLVVQSVTARTDEGGRSALAVAYAVAVGIGLHNLAEGLAIGSAFALGRASLGAFLVVGFMIHNVTEGPAVVAPVAGDDRPPLRHFVAIGAIAGAPVILGGWIGGFAYSPTLGAFFLAVGVGAIAQVVWEIAGMVRDRGGRVGSPTNALAFLGGLVVMYATDLLVML